MLVWRPVAGPGPPLVPRCLLPYFFLGCSFTTFLIFPTLTKLCRVLFVCNNK